MIKGIIIVNNHGKPRLVKFYQSVESEALQQTVIRRVFTQVAQRPDSFCNYLEGIVPEWGEHIKLIYRHYATLYFVFAVDAQESDLGILDLIQVFVEALDKCFENVCELDLIFHSDRVHYVLDEIVMGGMVLETNINAIIEARCGLDSYVDALMHRHADGHQIDTLRGRRVDMSMRRHVDALMAYQSLL